MDCSSVIVWGSELDRRGRGGGGEGRKELR